MLTEDGYVLKTPPTPLKYPSPEPFKTTTPVSNNYLPPVNEKPTPKPQPIQPRPTTSIPVRQTQPTQTKYQPREPTTPQTPFKQTYQTPAPTPPRRIPSTAPPQYLPPVGGDHSQESSNQKDKVIRGEAQLSPQIFPTKKRPIGGQFDQSGPAPGPSASKCASALVCTAENYCSSIGVISETPVEITPFRVPLTDCFIEGTGQPGKCCRDANYVDPWPVNLAGVCAQRNKVRFNLYFCI